MPANGNNQLWTQPTWDAINQAVLTEVGNIRVVQKLFSSSDVKVQDSPNIPADIFDPDTMTIAEGKVKVLMEISNAFSLTPSQVANEDTLHTCQTLAKLAAKFVARAEDGVLLLGSNFPGIDNVNITNQDSAEDGLLGDIGGDAEPIRRLEPADAVDLFTAVSKGIAQLNGEGQPGPYGLIVDSATYSKAFALKPDALVTTADQLQKLLPAGFYGTGSLPANTGLLASLGGDSVTIYAQDPVVEYTQTDRTGNSQFRVVERVQFVARDSTALVSLNLQAAGNAVTGAASAA